MKVESTPFIVLSQGEPTVVTELALGQIRRCRRRFKTCPRVT
jgi:hypothetical protein